MNPEDIRPGLVLRVISSDGLGAPLHTLATVESVDTSASGDWYCKVSYHDKRSSQRRTRLYRSHLWASDLGRFEIVPDEKAGISRSKNKNKTRLTLIQLSLPFHQDDDNFIAAMRSRIYPGKP